MLADRAASRPQSLAANVHPCLLCFVNPIIVSDVLEAPCRYNQAADFGADASCAQVIRRENNMMRPCLMVQDLNCCFVGYVQGVPTERELHTLENKAPVYRVLLSTLQQSS